ncbi:MAG: DUF4258 domain-containing protein [Planctomycetia bacterium]|nr:DUF4258 domain-containing protein [Planctomycetia bacterium]
MRFLQVLWDPDDEPTGNVQHIAMNGVTKEEVEDVLQNEDNRETISRTTGSPIIFGWTRTGRHIAVVWEEVMDDPRMAYPVTAYETPPLGG